MRPNRRSKSAGGRWAPAGVGAMGSDIRSSLSHASLWAVEPGRRGGYRARESRRLTRGWPGPYRRRMALLGPAVLAFWNDVADGRDAEFVHWHSREHIPERVGIPGFLRGRRGVAVAGRPRYFTLYETESLATLSGPDYVARLNAPTPWTQRALPLFRNSKRSACRVTLSLGAGVGGALATLELGPAPGREGELRDRLTKHLLPSIAERPGLIG